jgi:predicted ATPase/class 3 adenylate cyclase/Tfp pilus assembly protein PilF
LPAGTVTFLVTDIEGSTALWEQQPGAMRAALAHHDHLLRSAIESSNGHVVKTTGDGLYAVFRAASDALAASLTAQGALQVAQSSVSSGETTPEASASLELKVRMGIHTGEAELRDGDYFGTSMNRAARIVSVGHGKQILLSAATAELLRGDLPDGVTLRDMGEHRLKGVLDPQRLLQVIAPCLQADFPPLLSQTGHNLPAERDSFVGRGNSLDELTRRFAKGARLVSILGIGGTGKTRLVVRFGWSSLHKFPGGVWFCDLSQARSLDGIFHAVAEGLGVSLGKDDSTTQLGHAIAGRGNCLVILDNFEQVARHAEETLGRWLNRASVAQFLVSTREVLGLPGEEVLALAPLGQSDAATLFMQRAAAAKPGSEPNAEDQAAIPPLVKLLDGLPLAIELAAARVRVMPPRTLLLRMGERFKLLSSSGGRVDRQATLRTVLDWSWQLLLPSDKATLAQLSVFEGGFTLEALEAIVDLSGHDDVPWPADALQSVVQKSLVRNVADDRFDLLLSVQEYAAEQLRTEGRYPGSGPQALLAAEIRHGIYFADFERKTAAALSGDLDNLVAACRRAAARGDSAVTVSTLQAAWTVLRLRGPFRLGFELASVVQVMPALGPADKARVHLVAGWALANFGKAAEARDQFAASLRCAREIDDRIVEAGALLGLSDLDSEAGHLDSARERIESALVIARALHDRTLESEVQNKLGNHQMYLGQPEKALPFYEAALSLAREMRNRIREVAVLGNLGIIDVAGLRAATLHSEEAVALAHDVGNRAVEGNARCNLGLLYLLQGRQAEALDQLESALDFAREIGRPILESVVLCNLGMVHDSLSHFDEAEVHFKASLAQARELGNRRYEGQILGHLGLLHAHQSRFDDARKCLDAGETLLAAVSDQMGLGTLLCCRAETEHLAKAPDEAARALSRADAIANSVSARADSELGLALARVRTLVAAEHHTSSDGRVPG